MLKIRLARAWRKNLPFYRVVLTEAKRAPQHGYQKVLGFYNPLTKEFKIDQEETDKLIKNWAQYSDTVKKLVSKK